MKTVIEFKDREWLGLVLENVDMEDMLEQMQKEWVLIQPIGTLDSYPQRMIESNNKERRVMFRPSDVKRIYNL